MQFFNYQTGERGTFFLVWVPAPSRNYLSARLSIDASTPSNSGLPTGYGGSGHLRGKEHLYKAALLHYTDSGQANQFAKS
jgi:hypothetical protein